MACPGFVPPARWAPAACLALLLAACGAGDDGDDNPGRSIDAAADPSIDAAGDPAPDGAPPDASASADTQINCGADTCERATEVCCFTGFPNITTTCTGTGACEDLPGHCDGPEDCSDGQICCGQQEGSSCKEASACTGFAAARLCHTEADCVDDQICRSSDFVAWPICAAP